MLQSKHVWCVVGCLAVEVGASDCGLCSRPKNHNKHIVKHIVENMTADGQIASKVANKMVIFRVRP